MCLSIPGGHPNQKWFDETDWSLEDLSQVTAYDLSKTKAEKAAWKFVDDLKKRGRHLELVAINPALVFGPIIHGHDFASGDVNFDEP